MQSMRVYPQTQAWYDKYESGMTAKFVLFWDFTLNFLYKYFGMQSMRVYPHLKYMNIRERDRFLVVIGTQLWYEKYESGMTA